MQIQMQSVHFTADRKLLDFVQKKLDKLDTFHDRITSGEVYLKLDGNEASKIREKIVEVKLYLPGDTIFVKEIGRTFEEATDLVLDALKNQLKRRKDKQRKIANQEIVDSQQLVDVVNEDNEL